MNQLKILYLEFEEYIDHLQKFLNDTFIAQEQDIINEHDLKKVFIQNTQNNYDNQKLYLLKNDFEVFFEYTTDFFCQTYKKIDKIISSLHSKNNKLNSLNEKLTEINSELEIENNELKATIANYMSLIEQHKIKEEESTNLIIKLDNKISELREENRILKEKN